MDIHATEDLGARAPAEGTERIEEDGVVDEVNEIPGLPDIEPHDAGTGPDVRHDGAGPPRKVPDLTAAIDERKADAPP